MPNPSRADMEFLAVLVHRGFLTKETAATVMRANSAGSGSVDECLVAFGHFTEDQIRKLRKSGGEERPEVPGHDVYERIGAGATANVYRAKEKQSGREVALKILLSNLALDSNARERFLAEGKLLMDLQHPSIVKGYRVAHFIPRDGGDPVFLLSMEIVKGKTLLENLGEKRVFDEDSALRIIIDVAKGLEYLKTKGIVHRDIKPGNLMIGESGEVKMIDLGFAQEKTDASDKAASDTTVGTVHYLSPEQARGDALDVRSDIYALGVTLFHLTIGDLPFQGDAPSEVVRKHVLEELSSPALKGRRTSSQLHYFITKMMAKEREIRYSDPEQLIKDIERTTAGKKSLEYKPKK
ncbi:MAG: serine/threonine protein kinase [Planctomycetota bacterium]